MLATCIELNIFCPLCFVVLLALSVSVQKHLETPVGAVRHSDWPSRQPLFSAAALLH